MSDLVEKRIAYYSATPNEIKEIPSLSFDEAVRAMGSTFLNEFSQNVDVDDCIYKAIRALTSDGDVLIRRE